MMFELRKVTKTFQDETASERVLDPVSLTVKPGEFLCLMGPSGCGKSTLLRIMAGLDKPTTGQIIDMPKKVGFVFQNFGIFPWLNVAQNVEFGLLMSGMPLAKRRRIVQDTIVSIGLGGLEDHHSKELSGGQKQRVGIARALTMNPDILLLDEPFSALDTFTAEELRADVLRIWRERRMTIVMVTHLPEEAAQLADRIAVMAPLPGRIAKVIDNPLTRPRAQRSQPFFRQVDELRALIAPPKTAKELL